MKSFVVAICFACFVVAFGEKARFDYYRIYTVNIENEEKLKVLRKLHASPDGTSFLKGPNLVGQTASLIVPPHKFADISELFEAYKIENRITTTNLQK